MCNRYRPASLARHPITAHAPAPDGQLGRAQDDRHERLQRIAMGLPALPAKKGGRKRAVTPTTFRVAFSEDVAQAVEKALAVRIVYIPPLYTWSRTHHYLERESGRAGAAAGRGQMWGFAGGRADACTPVPPRDDGRAQVGEPAMNKAFNIAMAEEVTVTEYLQAVRASVAAAGFPVAPLDAIEAELAELGAEVTNCECILQQVRARDRAIVAGSPPRRCPLTPAARLLHGRLLLTKTRWCASAPSAASAFPPRTATRIRAGTQTRISRRSTSSSPYKCWGSRPPRSPSSSRPPQTGTPRSSASHRFPNKTKPRIVMGSMACALCMRRRYRFYFLVPLEVLRSRTVMSHREVNCN